MDTTDRYVAFGKQVYHVMRPFGSLPATLKFGMISKCAVNSKGQLHICQRADPPVIVFDRDGAFVRSFGDGQIVDAHGITVAPDNRVLVVDRDGHQVLCFSEDGRLLFTIGQRDHPRFQAPFSHPTDVAVGSKGDIYVADGYGNTMVHRFSADGKFKSSWGGLGAEPGKFFTPHGINVFSDGRVLVGDRENNRIQVFDADGKYLTEWGSFYHPMDIYVDSMRKLVFVTDQVPRVYALTFGGEVVGACKPIIAQGHGMSGDREGNLYFVDTRVSVITKLIPIH